ncbi:MAG TPA: hypothetical protein VGO57_12565 [Verrucomicrobiae bacterium]|jgi:hypothetical protein
MDELDFPSSAGGTASWLIFLGIMVLVCFALGIFVVWFTLFRNKGGKRKRKNHKRRRQKNPSLAETGGLPPVREEKNAEGPLPPPAS